MSFLGTSLEVLLFIIIIIQASLSIYQWNRCSSKTKECSKNKVVTYGYYGSIAVLCFIAAALLFKAANNSNQPKYQQK